LHAWRSRERRLASSSGAFMHSRRAPIKEDQTF
jgi:hypothetical protein